MAQLNLSIEYSEARGYNLGIAREVGLAEACVYQQLVFWQGRKGEGQWFYKSYDEMASELPLSISTIRRAYDKLKQRGYIETKLQKVVGTPMLHFRICQIVRMDPVKMNKSKDSVNLDKSINNKEPIKNNIDGAKASKNAQLTQHAEAIYELYLKCFKLPKDADLTDETLMLQAKKRYKFTDGRRAAVKRRLEDAGFKMLYAAILGYSREPWYTGDNDRQWTADLEKFICRSYEKVEEGANKYELQSKAKNSNDPWNS